MAKTKDIEEPKETQNAQETKEPSSKEKKGFPVIAAVGIGCLVILIAMGVGFAVAGKFVASSLGQKMVTEGVKKGIEAKTGVKVDTENGGVVSFTDTKTGSEVVMGGGTIPDDFPKDFPLYPQAKPAGTASGTEGGGKGFWLLLETSDAIANVVKYYGENLKSKGWTIDETMTFGDSSTYNVTKGNLSGTVVIAPNTDTDKKGVTTILVTLSPKAAESAQ